MLFNYILSGLRSTNKIMYEVDLFLGRALEKLLEETRPVQYSNPRTEEDTNGGCSLFIWCSRASSTVIANKYFTDKLNKSGHIDTYPPELSSWRPIRCAYCARRGRVKYGD